MSPSKPPVKKSVTNVLDGYKTIIMVFSLIAVGVAKSYGYIDASTAELLTTLAGGGALLSMRHAIGRSRE